MDRRLPVLKVWHEAFWYVSSLRNELVLVLIIPASATLAINLLWYTGVLPVNTFTGWIVQAASMVLYSFAAVSCHRLILLGPGSVPRFGVDGKNGREWRFLFLVVAICLIALALASLVAALYFMVGMPKVGAENQISGVSANLWTVVSFPLAVVVFLFLMQLSLVLPANAIDQRLQFGDATALARGNRMRLLLCCHSPVIVLSILWQTLHVTELGTLGVMIDVAVDWIFLPFGVALLSLSFKRLQQIQGM